MGGITEADLLRGYGLTAQDVDRVLYRGPFDPAAIRHRDRERIRRGVLRAVSEANERPTGDDSRIAAPFDTAGIVEREA